MRCSYRRPSWDFIPPERKEYDYDDILKGKRFWESLEKEYKDKEKAHEHKDHKKPLINYWLLLGIFSPIVGILYASVTVGITVMFLQMVKNIPLK